jgi:hypothetical protein
MSDVSRLAYYLALIGGILLVLLGILSLIGYSFVIIPAYIPWGFAYAGAIVSIVCGIIAVVGAKSAATLVWAVVLIIVGIIGGGLGGLLVIFGGIVGLIIVLSKKT